MTFTGSAYFSLHRKSASILAENPANNDTISSGKQSERRKSAKYGYILPSSLLPAVEVLLLNLFNLKFKQNYLNTARIIYHIFLLLCCILGIFRRVLFRLLFYKPEFYQWSPRYCQKARIKWRAVPIMLKKFTSITG